MIKLEISPYDGQPARVFPLTQGRICVGGNPDCDLVIDSGIVSGEHAEILVAEDETVTVVDLGSTNGTYINGEGINRGTLKAGDKVRFGNVDAVLRETQYPRKSQQAEASVFESSAISRAKLAMENQKKGLASGASDLVRVDSGAVRAAAAGQIPISESDQSLVPRAPDTVPAVSQPAALLPATDESRPDAEALRQAQEIVEVQELELKRITEAFEMLSRERQQQDAELAGNRAHIEKLQNELSAADGKSASMAALQQELDRVRAKAENESALQAKLSDYQESFQELEGQLNQKSEALQELQQRFEAQQIDSQSTDVALDELREKLERAVSDRRELDAQLAEKSDRAQALGSEVEMLQSRLEDLTATLRDSGDQSDFEVEINKHIASEEALKARIAELESRGEKRAQAEQSLRDQLAEAQATIEAQAVEETDSSRREAELEAQLEKIAELQAAVTGLTQEKQDLSDQLAEAQTTIEAQAVENRQFRSRDRELQAELDAAGAEMVETRAELNRLSESYQKAATNLAGVSASEAALKRALGEKERELVDLKEQLAVAANQVDEGTAEKLENASRELSAVRDELERLKVVHGDVDSALLKLEAARKESVRLEQELQSGQPERERMQKELAASRQEIETAKLAATAEHAEILAKIESSRMELATLTESVNEAQRQEDARKRQLSENLTKMESLQQLAKEDLASLETEKANAANEVKEATLSVRAMELKCKNIDAQMAKQAKGLTRLERKLGRRKKLLERLKDVARREREVEKKIEIGKKYIDVADSHTAGKKTPDVVLPWDVDRALAEREKAIEEARMIQREVEAVKVALKARQDELAQADARIRESEERGMGQNADLKQSSEDANRMIAELRGECDGLSGKNSSASDDVTLPG